MSSGTSSKPFIPSPQQAAFFDWIDNGTGSVVLEAVAGAGKTTTLIQGLERMRGQVFFGAYNKQIADEIKLKAFGVHPKLTVSTMHAAGFKHLSRALGKLEVNGDKCRNLFRFYFESARHLQSPVLKLVSLAKQAGVDALFSQSEDVWLKLISHFDVEVIDEKRGRDNTDQIISCARKVLAESHVQDVTQVDFDDMIYAALRRNVPVWEHDWVLIDEAQDTNATRRALALRLLKRGGRLVAVGDRHQAIYGFTGADATALDDIKEAVSAAELPLTVTYRCPQAVVKHAQQWVSHITAAESAPAGQVDRMDVKDLVKTAQPGSAILCRFNRPLIALVYDFIRAGKAAKVEGRDIGNGLKSLARNWSSKTYDELESWLEVYEQREAAKHRAQENEAKAAAVEDKVACLRTVIERTKELQPGAADPVGAVCTEVDAIFADTEGNAKGLVLLSSIHKSKGREWPRVFWLQTGPSTWARKQWEQDQEVNLMYVATTRAQTHLTLVGM